MKKLILMTVAIVLLMSGVAIAWIKNFVIKDTFWLDGASKCHKRGKVMAAVADFKGKWPKNLIEGNYWTSTRYEDGINMATIVSVKKIGNEIKYEISSHQVTKGKYTRKLNVWCITPKKK